MKVLVATATTQGARSTDFNDCVEGELVWMLEPCPRSQRNPAGECGCGRSFSGMNSHGSTTTSLVRDIPDLTVASYTEALEGSFDAQGWCSCCTSRDPEEIIQDLISYASLLPEGTVVERSLERLRVRALTS